MWLEQEGHGKDTIKLYISVAIKFQKWVTEHLGDNKFIPQHVSLLELQRWKVYLMTEATYTPRGAKNKEPQKYEVSSVQTFIKSIKTYFQYLAESKQISNNFAVKLKPPKIQASLEPSWLEKRDRSRLINYITDPDLRAKNVWKFVRNKAIVYLGLHGGLRKSEISSLSIDDVVLRISSLHVRYSKGEKTRWVPMNNDLKNAVLEWLEIRGEQDHRYLFTSQKSGGPLSKQAIWNLCISIGEKLGIPEFTPHTLRHTFGRDLIVAGRRIEDVADLMGHSSIESTRVYVRSRSSDLRAVVQDLSQEDD